MMYALATDIVIWQTIILMSLSLSISLAMLMTNTPFTLWILMEISNAILILAFTSQYDKDVSSPPLFTMINIFTSSLILAGIMLNSNTLISMGLTVKMGLFPAHNWFPLVIWGSSWELNMFFLTLPKIPPFLFLSTLNNYSIVLTSAALTALISSVKLLLVNDIKWIVAMSSMIHSGWMVLAMSISLKAWSIYFLLYSINMIMVCQLLSMYAFLNLPDEAPHSPNVKITFLMLMFSSMSMPPVTFFISKLLVLSLSGPETLCTLTILIASSTIAILYYSRLFKHILFKYKKSIKIKWILKIMRVVIKWSLIMILLVLII